MGQPTGFARYYIIDDYSSSATGATGTASGEQISPDFQAATLADAQTMAQMFANLFNRSVRLVQTTGTPPWTPLYTPSSCRVMPSAVPPSVTF